jgi:hypothetical protein
MLSKPVAPLVVGDSSGRCPDHSRPILSRVLDATNHRGSSIKLVRCEPDLCIYRCVTGDAAAFAKFLQNRRPTITSIKKLRIGPAGAAIDNGDTFGIEFARAARKFERCQWRSIGLVPDGRELSLVSAVSVVSFRRL